MLDCFLDNGLIVFPFSERCSNRIRERNFTIKTTNITPHNIQFFFQYSFIKSFNGKHLTNWYFVSMIYWTTISHWELIKENVDVLVWELNRFDKLRKIFIKYLCTNTICKQSFSRSILTRYKNFKHNRSINKSSIRVTRLSQSIRKETTMFFF